MEKRGLNKPDISLGYHLIDIRLLAKELSAWEHERIGIIA
jgi:Uma2 family endonuclease